MLLVPTLALAGYSVDVNSVPDLKGRVRTLAIAPGSCPPGVDCLWLEDKLRDAVADHRSAGVMFVLSARQVREKMFALGIDAVDADARAKLAEAMSLDAFVIPIVQFSGMKSSGAVGTVTGSVFGIAQTEIAKGAVELLIVEPKSGAVLMKGIGYGDSGWKAEKGVLLSMFKKMLSRAFSTTP